MTDRLLTPSKITAWLDCAHYLTLKHQVEAGLLAAPPFVFGSMARLLADKGLEHEADCLAEYESRGLSVLRVEPRQPKESFAGWTARVGDALNGNHDVLYQMPLAHDGVRGIADFLLRTADPDTGVVSWEPVDAKLARAEAKPGHVLQLCFYAEALEAVTGVAPARLHLWLGSGSTQTLPAQEYLPYWRRLKNQLSVLAAEDGPTEATEPEPCPHCAFCEFAGVCEDAWRSKDSLIYVAGIRSQDRAGLEAGGLDTLAALAHCGDDVPEVRPERRERLRSQALLQVQARSTPHAPPPFRLLTDDERGEAGPGFALLPEPDDGDVFLDFEGHPFWRADTGLFFLFGLIAQEADASWGFVAIWAHDRAEEAAAVQRLVDYLADRRAKHPGMHVYHYNHTERSSLERLATDHGVAEVALGELIATGAFVDLLVVARNAIQAGVESYGLKHLELLTGYQRGHDIDAGAGAVVEYEGYTRTRDPIALKRIAAYNEDDVRATRALRDWLLEQRDDDIAWRPAWLEPDAGYPELDARIEALHAFGVGTPEHLLGDVLGYWVREWRAYVGPRLAQCAADATTLFEVPDLVAGLVLEGLVERIGKSGTPITPAMRFRFPAQDVDGIPAAKTVLYSTESGIGFAQVARLDAAAGELDLVWNTKAQELGEAPTVVALHDWVDPMVKSKAVDELGARVLDPAAGAPNRAALALLRRELPAFTAGHGPAGALFDDDVAAMCAWAPHLDHSYVAVQGPPGTGKTYRGAHLIHALIRAGKRVGITAVSHHAITNLLEEVVRAFTDAGDLALLNAVQRTPHAGALANVSYPAANSAAAKAGVNLVAGTTWLFSGNDMAGAPVDVLVVDEAGQLSLADALAASRSALNLILMGDPLQLPQVALAAHPSGAGVSVLEHVLGDDVTMPSDRGVFITETRRMHPDVCGFISDAIYEGRLTSHASCAGQGTAFGTGLRWLPATHAGRSTESAEEAEIVAAEAARLIGTPWTDQDGLTAPMRAEDILVVAPFNDQVRLLRARLASDPVTAGVQVGTVDKFQGRQAAVVFFTMTTSSAADLSRGADFLFSRNRLNVAVSRARCLAYLVCTEELLNSRARNTEEMRLIATLCAFVERCD